MKGYGVTGLDHVGVAFAKFKAKRDAEVKRLHDIYTSNVQSANITYIEGTASFMQEHIVEISERKLYAPHILIASCSAATETENFEGAELCMNSDDFYAMKELPKSMVVIGGNYISIELA